MSTGDPKLEVIEPFKKQKMDIDLTSVKIEGSNVGSERK